MVSKYRYAVWIFSVFTVSCIGCAQITEVTKSVWGSSTKALEDARPQAITKDFQCQVKECFDAVLDIAKKKKMEVFSANRQKSLIVLMHVQGSIHTTEVGVFLSEAGVDRTKVEVASLSLGAKEAVADRIFRELKETFKPVE